jgi:hypothetical protein
VGARALLRACAVKLTENVAPLCTNKRITVFFRGSVMGGKDWATNFNMFYVKVPVPQLLQTVPLEKDIEVHRGFYSKFAVYSFASNFRSSRRVLSYCLLGYRLSACARQESGRALKDEDDREKLEGGPGRKTE